MRNIIPTIIVIMLAGCATAVGGGYGQGGLNSDGRSYSEARADNAITAGVITRLVEDPEIPAVSIEVSTRHGVVTLHGTVPSSLQSRRAARLASSVEGVVKGNNELRVAP